MPWAFALALAAGPRAGWALAASASELPGLGSLLPGVSVYGPLAEIPAGHWAYRSLEELIAAGVVVEYSPGLLDGRHTISRYEAAMLLVDAFRRAGAVRETVGASGELKSLLVGPLLQRVQKAGLPSGRIAQLEQVLRALARELAGELAVLGYRMDGVSDAHPARPSTEVAVQMGSTVGGAGDGGATGGPQPSTAPGGASPSAAGSAGASSEASAAQGTAPPLSPEAGSAASPAASGLRLPVAGYSYRLGLSYSEPGRFSVSGMLPVGNAAGSTEFGALLSMPQEQWLWARVGEVAAPGGSVLAWGERQLVGLQGIEAHLVGRGGKAGVVIAREQATKPSASGDGPPSQGSGAITALGSSLILSPDVVVGATIVRGAPSTQPSSSGQEAPTVTSLTTRLRPRPWLTLTGEYAQNLWALPVLDAAMRLDATVQLGDVRLGARIGNVSPDFRPAVGELRPGARVGLDTAVRLGEVELRASTTRLEPTDGGSPEIATGWGVTVGSALGPSLEADFERVSLQELTRGSSPDRTRTALRLGWGTERTRVAMGVAWSNGGSPATTGGGRADLQAEAAISYQLSPGASVVFGYRLIDFDASSTSGAQSNASAQITLRF